MGNHQLVGIKEWLNMLPDFRKDWGIGNVFFMNAMDLNVAPEKRRLWIDQGVELINDLILPNDDQRKRAGDQRLPLQFQSPSQQSSCYFSYN